MKKYIKLLGTFIALIMLTGCSDKSLVNLYEKMQISENNINGYVINLTLSGTYNNEEISDSASIINYMNKSYKITSNVTTYYVTENGNYIKQKNDDRKILSKNYVEYIESVPYIETNLYLEPLKSSLPTGKVASDIIGNKKYDTYSFNVSNKSKGNLLKYTSLDSKELKGNCIGTVWIDEDGYIYKIEYDYLSVFNKEDNLRLIIFYNSINKVKEIKIEEN